MVTSLPSNDALAAITLAPEGLAEILPPDAVHVSTSAVTSALSRRVARAHADRLQGLARGLGRVLAAVDAGLSSDR
jgi:3-hydroxyisobutyrate dehydrogenase-like beta-hydroxyacid dehydrogenase